MDLKWKGIFQLFEGHYTAVNGAKGSLGNMRKKGITNQQPCSLFTFILINYNFKLLALLALYVTTYLGRTQYWAIHTHKIHSFIIWIWWKFYGEKTRKGSLLVLSQWHNYSPFRFDYRFKAPDINREIWGNVSSNIKLSQLWIGGTDIFVHTFPKIGIWNEKVLWNVKWTIKTICEVHFNVWHIITAKHKHA